MVDCQLTGFLAEIMYSLPGRLTTLDGNLIPYISSTCNSTYRKVFNNRGKKVLTRRKT